MKLRLERFKYGEDTTWGTLYIDNKKFCYTVEDTVRATGIKVMGKTAIPADTYKVVMSMSGKFKRRLAMIYTEDNGYEIKSNDIGFKGVRFHRGNTEKDSYGCVIIGFDMSDKGVYNSTACEAAFNSLLEAATDAITLEVINKPQIA